MVQRMIQYNNVKKLVMLPNVTNISMSIDERSALLAQEIKKISERYESKVHVVAHSFTGVDARAAISLHNAHENVQSLSTICSPH